MKRSTFGVLLLALGAAAPLAGQAADPKADQLAHQLIDSMGGEKSW